MKLFAIYIGGEHERANIELHDMRFVIAETIDDTHDALRKQWWGKPGTMHLDCWSELTHADGYQITLNRDPSPDPVKLYYINLGGYDANQFTEMHKNMFVVAETEAKAKIKALKTVRHWNTFHQDEIFEAEQSFCLNDISSDASWYVHLKKINDESQPPFICRYVKLRAR